MSVVKGWNCTVKIDGSEILRHRGVEISQKANKIDITTKNSGGAEESCKGIDAWETGSIEVILDSGDAIIATLQSAYDAGTNLTLLATRGTGKTQTGTCWVSELTTNYPHDDVVKITYKLQGTGLLVTTT